MDEWIDWLTESRKRSAIGFLTVVTLLAMLIPAAIRDWNGYGSTSSLKLVACLVVVATNFAFAILRKTLPRSWGGAFGKRWVGFVLIGTLAVLATLAIAYILFGMYAIWAFAAATDPVHRYAPLWLLVPLLIASVLLLAWAWWSYGRSS